MGLSSSQARLLSLTGRMHDIEYKAQKLEAQKLQMANESTQVYKEYENALNKTKIQLKQICADGSAEYIDATYNNMLDSEYYIQYANSPTLWGANGPVRDGKICITQEDLNIYNESKNNEDLFVALKMGLTGTTLSTDHNINGYKEIYTASQLSQVTGSGNYILMADIDMSGTNWTPKYFNGHLNGNGHKIIGLKTSLFSSLSSSTKIENLELANVNINSTQSNIGAIAYTSNGAEISNVSISGNIYTTGWSSIGGLIGEAKGGTYIHDVTVNAAVSGTTLRSGGIVGGITEGANNIIENAVFSGSVEATNNPPYNDSRYYKAHSGGIVGEVYGATTITNCYAEGTVYAKSMATSEYAGGIVGNHSSSTLTINNSNANTTEEVEGSGTTGDIYGNGGSTVVTQTVAPTKEGANVVVNEVLQNDDLRNMFKKIAAGEYYIDNEKNLVEGNENNTEWFTNMINAGLLFIFKKDRNNDEFYQVNVATDTSLQEVTDEVDLKKAEAKYEADMRKINQKDKKFDTDLAAMEAERNAIKTEMETLKSVARDNVDRTYKLFG